LFALFRADFVYIKIYIACRMLWILSRWSTQSQTGVEVEVG